MEMDFFNVFEIPRKPGLKFGEPLDHYWRDGTLHAGLKDLFLKAYLSAKNNDHVDPSDKTAPKYKTHRVLLALNSGSNTGQGSLARRISLKEKLETGAWLIPAQTPAGAPLWLLRHFLGRLPRPLLRGSHWKIVSEACGATAVSSSDASRQARIWEVLERIAVTIEALSQAEFVILALLTLLIRKLSIENEQKFNEELHEDILNGLSQYFTGSIIARPFRPGLQTAADEFFQPLLVFLSRYWYIVFQEISETPVLNPFIKKYMYCSKSSSEQLHKYIGNDIFDFVDDEDDNDDDNDDEEEKVYKNKFIGFESLLITEDNKQSKKIFDNDADTECLYKRNAINDLNIIKSDLTSNQINIVKKAPEQNIRFENLKIDAKINEVQTFDFQFMEKKNTAAAVDVLMDSKIKFCNAENAGLNFQKNSTNVVKSSSEEYEYFSVPNSEDSQ